MRMAHSDRERLNLTSYEAKVNRAEQRLTLLEQRATALEDQAGSPMAQRATALDDQAGTPDMTSMANLVARVADLEGRMIAEERETAAWAYWWDGWKEFMYSSWRGWSAIMTHARPRRSVLC